MALKFGGFLSGTFSAPGQSDSLLVQGSVTVVLNFGTGPVVIEGSTNDSLYIAEKLPDGTTSNSYTADARIDLYFASPTYVRLNCTAESVPIDYTMSALVPTSAA
jgi:hypothetical protein